MNINSGYGQVIGQFPFTGSGKIFIVGDSSTANLNMLEQMFIPDSDGDVRFFSTIDAAIGECTADAGDTIYVMPGHTETISGAAGIAMDVAGVAIVGLSRGTLKPTLTFSTTASDINVSAANCLIKNIRMVSSVNSLVNFIDVDEGQFALEDCDFVTSSAKEALCFINIATTKDDFIIRNCTFLQPTDPAGTGGAASTGAIYCVDSENILIEGCRFRGYFETAIVHNKTTKVQNLVVRDCELSNSIVVPFILVAASTGVCKDCYGATLAATDAAEANVYGTLGIAFWICNSQLGNDSGGGGQNGVGAAACS